MRLFKKSLILFILFSLSICLGFSQTKPAFMLLEKDLQKIRESLKTEPFKTLYKGVYGSLNANLTSDNTNSNSRRANAGIAKNCAFILVMNKQGDCITDLLQSDKDMLEKKVIIALENLNTDPGTVINQGDWQWRAKDMQDYLSSYDLMRFAGISEMKLTKAKNNLVKYAGNLYREATRSILGISFFSTTKNNHALMVCGALGIASLVLQDAKSTDAAESPQAWFNTALWNIDNLLWKDESRKLADKDSISGYAEGIHYLKYPMLNCLPFFRGLANIDGDTTYSLTFNNLKRQIRSPLYDKTYNNIWDWVVNSLLPNGKLPQLEDTFFDVSFPILALLGKPYYNRILDGGAAELSKDLQYNFDLRPEYICANTQQWLPDSTEPTFSAMPYAGSLVFRSDWSKDATYLHATAKHGFMRISAGGHNQADETSFMLMKNNQVLALFPGYLKYDRRTEVATALQRSMILVDDKATSYGTPGDAGGADAYITDFCGLPSFSFGEMKTNYQETDFTRRIFFLNKSNFFISDIIAGAKPHKYTWQLQGNGLENGEINTTGIFINDFVNSRSLYSRKGASMLACVASNSELEFATRREKHELHYDSATYHTTTLANTNSQNSDYACVLVPTSFENLNKENFDSLAKIYVNNNVKFVAAGNGVMVNNPNINLNSSDKIFNTFISTPHIQDSLKTDAETVFLADNSKNPTTLITNTIFAANVKNFSLYNAGISFKSNNTINFGLEKIGVNNLPDYNYKCYVSSKCKIKINILTSMSNRKLIAKGEAVIGTSYVNNELEVELQKGYFNLDWQLLGVYEEPNEKIDIQFNSCQSFFLSSDKKFNNTKVYLLVYDILGKKILSLNDIYPNTPVVSGKIEPGVYFAVINYYLNNSLHVFRKKFVVN